MMTINLIRDRVTRSFMPERRSRRSLRMMGVLAILVASGPLAAQQVALPPNALANILLSPAVPFAGNPAGETTVVEYFDVNCPYCRILAGTLRQLIAVEPTARILFKDWPIFGGVSVYAAKAALAARWQGRYLQAHDALMSSPSRVASEAQVRDILHFAGINLVQLDKDLIIHGAEIGNTLARNDYEAKKLGFQGTPGLIVEDFVVSGGARLQDLRLFVETATATKKNAH